MQRMERALAPAADGAGRGIDSQDSIQRFSTVLSSAFSDDDSDGEADESEGTVAPNRCEQCLGHCRLFAAPSSFDARVRTTQRVEVIRSRTLSVVDGFAVHVIEFAELLPC